MKKQFLLCVLIACLLLLCACTEDPIPGSSSTPPKTTASTAPSQPAKDCADGHDFADNEDACVRCGLDYFSATLEFQFADSRDHYILIGPGECTRTNIVVPETYKGRPVKKIADNAFKRTYGDPTRTNCDKIETITLPDSITEIGAAAFDGCRALRRINIPHSITEIRRYTFSQCVSLASIEIPAGVTAIGDRAFSECTELSELVLPQVLTAIGDHAFTACRNLKVLEIPDSVEAMGDAAFSSCKSLERVKLPRFLKQLPYELFFGCSSLTTVEFGDHVQSIEQRAFAGCGFESLTLPESVTHIAADAFNKCRSLRSISVPSCIQTIDSRVFEGCNALEYNMYEGVGYLGNAENPYLVMVAFADDSLTELKVHNDARFMIIKYSDGMDMTNEVLYRNLESVHIGNNVSYIALGIFFGAKDLTSITASPENPVFHSQNNCLIETESKKIVAGCRTSVIPDDGSVKTIGKQSFSFLEEVRMITIPDAVTSIEGNAFSRCPNLEALVIGSGVQMIDHDILILSDKFTTVYYHGTESQWKNISIVGRDIGTGFGGNVELLAAAIYFYSEEQPAGEGNYWHYVDGIPTPWKPEE